MVLSITTVTVVVLKLKHMNKSDEIEPDQNAKQHKITNGFSTHRQILQLEAFPITTICTS